MTHLCASMPLCAHLELSAVTRETGRNHIWTVIASLSLCPLYDGKLFEGERLQVIYKVNPRNKPEWGEGWLRWEKKGGQIWEYSENQLALKGEGGNMPLRYCSPFWIPEGTHSQCGGDFAFCGWTSRAEQTNSHQRASAFAHWCHVKSYLTLCWLLNWPLILFCVLQWRIRHQKSPVSKFSKCSGLLQDMILSTSWN